MAIRVLVLLGLYVSARGGRFGYVMPSRQGAYKAMRRDGMSKGKAAAIANGGHFFPQRSAMARKGAQTRKRRGR